MARKHCYWTRKLELDLVDFVREKDFIWKPNGNTNHHILQKYKAYAEFAAKLGRGFTARSVRDRWVNIRNTFNHNVRRVDKSKKTARTPSDVYVPCWPLWKPLQFLRDVTKRENLGYENYHLPKYTENDGIQIKTEETVYSNNDESDTLKIRERGQRTDRPRRKNAMTKKTNAQCAKVVNDLVRAMKPLKYSTQECDNSYWFFGRHVTERLNSMRKQDADSASADILQLLKSWPRSMEP